MQDDLSNFAGQAAVAVSVLKSIAHEGRLLVLCYLSEAGEMSVGDGDIRKVACEHAAYGASEPGLDTKETTPDGSSRRAQVQ